MAKKTDDKIVNTKNSFFFGVGRRKTASARVRLYPADKEVEVAGQKVAKGEIWVNGLPVEKYFSGPWAKTVYSEPFRTTNTLGKFKTTVVVTGSGQSGQLGATVLGISRALVVFDEEKFRPILRKRGLLTRDPRAREREKAGLMGARKEKQSPKR